MEKWGIRVKGEELKAYGEKLQVRIAELEKLIYEQAGEEFNINSPKQLGVILFEKMVSLVEEKQRRAILQLLIFWKNLRQSSQSLMIFWNTDSLPS